MSAFPEELTDTSDNVGERKPRTVPTSWPDVATLKQQKPDVLVALYEALKERDEAVGCKLTYYYLDPLYKSLAAGSPCSVHQFVTRLVDAMEELCGYFVNLDFDYNGQDLGKMNVYVRTKTGTDDDGNDVYENVRTEQPVVSTTGKLNFPKAWTWPELMQAEGCRIGEFPPQSSFVTDDEWIGKFSALYESLKKVFGKLVYVRAGYATVVYGGNSYDISGSSGYRLTGEYGEQDSDLEYSSAQAAWDAAVALVQYRDTNYYKAKAENGSMSGILGTYKKSPFVNASSYFHTYNGYGLSRVHFELLRQNGEVFVNSYTGEKTPAYDSVEVGHDNFAHPSGVDGNTWVLSGRWSDSIPKKDSAEQKHNASAYVRVKGVAIDFMAARGCKNGKAPVLVYRLSEVGKDWWRTMDGNGLPDAFEPSGLADSYTNSGSNQTKYAVKTQDRECVVAFRGLTPDASKYVERRVQLTVSGSLSTPINEGLQSTNLANELPKPVALNIGQSMTATAEYYDDNFQKKTKQVSAKVIQSTAHYETVLQAYGSYLDYSGVFDFT